MKKLIVAAFICCMFSFTACSSNTSESENVNLSGSGAAVESSTTQTANTELPDKNSFKAVPDEAEKNFDVVINASKKEFSEEKGKKLYGYQGVQKINNVDCYIFVVYSENEDIHTQLGTFAVVKDSGELYKLDKSVGKFEKVVQDNDGKEAAWADTETDCFVKYLSADKANSAESAKQANSIKK